jgi:hypothetical protein
VDAPRLSVLLRCIISSGLSRASLYFYHHFSASLAASYAAADASSPPHLDSVAVIDRFVAQQCAIDPTVDPSALRLAAASASLDPDATPGPGQFMSAAIVDYFTPQHSHTALATTAVPTATHPSATAVVAAEDDGLPPLSVHVILDASAIGPTFRGPIYACPKLKRTQLAHKIASRQAKNRRRRALQKQAAGSAGEQSAPAAAPASLVTPKRTAPSSPPIRKDLTPGAAAALLPSLVGRIGHTGRFAELSLSDDPLFGELGAGYESDDAPEGKRAASAPHSPRSARSAGARSQVLDDIDNAASSGEDGPPDASSGESEDDHGTDGAQGISAWPSLLTSPRGADISGHWPSVVSLLSAMPPADSDRLIPHT